MHIRKTTQERQSRTIPVETHVLEIVNRNKNTVAQDCKCLVDLSELGLARITGKWWITDDELIQIAHTEMIALFTKIEDKLLFFLNVGNSIKHPEFDLTDDLRTKKIHIQIQATNADFPSEVYSQTIEYILQHSKTIP